MFCLGIINTSSMRDCKHPIFMKIDYTEQEIIYTYWIYQFAI